MHTLPPPSLLDKPALLPKMGHNRIGSLTTFMQILPEIFYAVYKHCQSKMYSEDEVKELADRAYERGRDDVKTSQKYGKYFNSFKEWFNNNKK